MHSPPSGSSLQRLIESFEHIYIHEASADTETGQRLKKLFPADRMSLVTEEPLKSRSGSLSAEEFDRSKRLLYLCEFPGQFFKRCPGARPGLTCCNYFVLNLGLQCDMNCSYCYLQSFINSPLLKIYSNLDTALNELRDFGDPSQKFRIGTGEVIDSLSLDPLTLYSRRLIEFFRDFPNWRLEFKTKSDRVEQFLDCEHAGNVIVSWSINPQNIIAGEEHGTASLSSRLQAARRCADRGFLISFHIDPLIWHKDWKSHYAELVDQICSQFTPKEIPVMSLGALRFQPEQRHMMRERFGMQSLVTQAEVFPGKDGKLRYDRLLRQEMFQFVIERFKAHSQEWNVFLCMESPETWLGTVSKMPKSEAGLKELFDHRVIRSFQSRSESMSNAST